MHSYQCDASMNTWLCVCGQELFWLIVQGVFLFRSGLSFVNGFNSPKPKANHNNFVAFLFTLILLYSALKELLGLNIRYTTSQKFLNSKILMLFLKKSLLFAFIWSKV